jgi:hypothetical protein
MSVSLCLTSRLRLQVRWVPYRQCWVTAADDDMIRLWSPMGDKLHQFVYTGGSVQVSHSYRAAPMLASLCSVPPVAKRQRPASSVYIWL